MMHAPQSHLRLRSSAPAPQRSVLSFLRAFASRRVFSSSRRRAASASASSFALSFSSCSRFAAASPRTSSSDWIKPATSARKRSCDSLTALHLAKGRSDSGRSVNRGILASLTSTGMTRFFFASANSISRRTKSCGSSSRRIPLSSTAVNQPRPMTEISTSHLATCWFITSTKSSPGAISSMSMNSWSPLKTCSSRPNSA